MIYNLKFKHQFSYIKFYEREFNGKIRKVKRFHFKLRVTNLCIDNNNNY